jgi:hypothetical protein
MTRSTDIQAKFKARPKLRLPANKRFCWKLGRRFLPALNRKRRGKSLMETILQLPNLRANL